MGCALESIDLEEEAEFSSLFGGRIGYYTKNKKLANNRNILRLLIVHLYTTRRLPNSVASNKSISLLMILVLC